MCMYVEICYIYCYIYLNIHTRELVKTQKNLIKIRIK